MEEEKVRITMVGCQVIQGGRIGVINNFFGGEKGRSPILNNENENENEKRRRDGDHFNEKGSTKTQTGTKREKEREEEVWLVARGKLAGRVGVLHGLLTTYGLIDAGTKSVDLERALSGEQPRRRIAWKGTKKVLAVMVQELVERGWLGPKKGFWRGVAGAFEVDGKEINEVSIRKSADASRLTADERNMVNDILMSVGEV